MTERIEPNIELGRDRYGRPVYRVQVRRKGVARNGTFLTLSEARGFRDRVIEAVGAGVTAPAVAKGPDLIADGSVRVFEIASRFVVGIGSGQIRNKASRRYKPSVVQKYDEALRLSVLPRVGNLLVAELTRRRVQRLINAISQDQTPEHARKALTALRAALRLAIDDDLIDADPCSQVRVPVSEAGERPARLLTVPEMGGILTAARGHDETKDRRGGHPPQREMVMLLSSGAGLRAGEVLSLRWGPVTRWDAHGRPLDGGLDAEGGTVAVVASRSRYPLVSADGETYDVDPKTQHSRRVVPLAPEDVRTVKRFWMASGRPQNGERVIRGRDAGGALAPSIPGRYLRDAVKTAKLSEPWPRFHDLRHHYASALLAAGVARESVARLLGHGDVGLLARYGHPMPEDMAASGEALQRLRERAEGAA